MCFFCRDVKPLHHCSILQHSHDLVASFNYKAWDEASSMVVVLVVSIGHVEMYRPNSFILLCRGQRLHFADALHRSISAAHRQKGRDASYCLLKFPNMGFWSCFLVISDRLWSIIG